MTKKQLLEVLNNEGNALQVWCSSTSDNILTKHYNYLWEHVKQIKNNTMQKTVTFQQNAQNEKGEYNTFDVIINEVKRKKGIFYSVIEIKQY